MRIEPCPACGKPIDVDDESRHLPDPPDTVVVGFDGNRTVDTTQWSWTYPSDHQ